MGPAATSFEGTLSKALGPQLLAGFTSPAGERRRGRRFRIPCSGFILRRALAHPARVGPRLRGIRSPNLKERWVRGRPGSARRRTATKAAPCGKGQGWAGGLATEDALIVPVSGSGIPNTCARQGKANLLLDPARDYIRAINYPTVPRAPRAICGFTPDPGAHWTFFD